MTGIHFFIRLLLLLCAGHALCDYPLQRFLSEAKNHMKPIPGVPAWQALLAHCFIHMGMVLLITNSIPLAVAELVIHFYTDEAKCDNRISFSQDQAIHYGCKILWAMIACWSSQ